MFGFGIREEMRKGEWVRRKGEGKEVEREIGKLMCTAKVSLFELKRGHWKYIQVLVFRL